jgi:hypothetical protein
MKMVYSFSDISFVISHPVYGQFIAQGEGIGSINVAMTNDVSVQEVAADGAIMTTKIKADNGTINLSILQTSSLNKYLTGLFNYLKTASAAEWERATMTINAPTIEQTTVATRVSFQKHADKSYQQQGQMVTWAFLSAAINHQ